MAKPPSPTGPGAANVDAAKQLKDAMTAMAGVSAALERSFQNQAKAMQDIAKAVSSMESTGIAGQMTQMSESIKQALDAINKLAGTTTAALTATGTAAAGTSAAVGKTAADIKAAGDAAARAADSTEDFGDILGDLTETTDDFGTKIQKVGKYLKKEFPIATGAVLGALSGLAQGFRNVMAVGKGVIGIFETVANTAFELATAIIAIPFSIYNGLIDMAKKHAATMSEYAQAVEKVRENFGSLSNKTPKAIFGTARALGTLKLSGVSALQVFGNLAERVEKLNALFMAGGPAIRNLSQEFVDSGGALMGYQKGLGLSDEMMGSIAQQAQSMGKPMGKILNDMTKQALSMGKAFSLDSKIISREMGKAMMDMKHFGDMSVKQIGQAVVYAEKLGVSLEKITGAMDSFSTFDSAAEGVSKLNEAFGTNISSMQLLEAESPAETLEILRKEMARVGVDGEKLNRHYRSLITQVTSYDDATIKSVFSSKNQGVSLKEIQKQSEKAEKKTLSQAEAMSKLSDSMERMIKAMDLGEGGFFAAFLKGITEGIMKSPAMIKILSNIATALSGVIQEGRALGTFLMKTFPGIQDFTDGLADLFNPARIRRLFADIRTAIQDFVLALSDPKKKFSFGDMMDRIKKAFLDFFNKEEPAGQKTLKGFNVMFMAISKILAEGIKWALLEMAGLVRGLIDFIKNPKKIPGVGAAGDAMVSFFDPIIAAIVEVGPILWSALVELFELAFSMLFNWIKTSLWGVIEPYVPYIVGGLALIFFGPAFMQSMLGAFIGAMTSVFIKGVGVAATRAAASGMLGKAAQALATAAKSAPASAPDVGGPVKAAGAAIDGAPGPGKVGKAQATGSIISGPLIIKLLLALAGIIAIGLVTFYLAAKMVEGMSIETIVKALAVIGIMAVNLAITSAALFVLSKIPKPSADLLITLGLVGLVVIALAALAYVAVSMLGGFTIEQAASAMLIVAGIAIATIPVALSLGILMGVGAIISASGGSALAAAAVGLAGLAIMMVAIVALGIHVVKAASAAKFSRSQISDAMLLLMVSITALGTILAGIAVMTVASTVGLVAGVISAIVSVFTGDNMLMTFLKLTLSLGEEVIKRSSALSEASISKATTLMVASLAALGLILAAVAVMAVASTVGAVAMVISSLTSLFTGDNILMKFLKIAIELGEFVISRAAELKNKDAVDNASKLTVVAIQALGLILTAVLTMSIAGTVGMLGTLMGVFGGSLLKSLLTSLIDLADLIVDKAKNLPTDIDKKANAIIKAIDAIVGIITAIPAVIESTKKTTRVGGLSTVEPQVKELTDFVDKLFGKSGTGLIGLVEKVIEAVRTIGASEQTLKAASALASVMAAIGEILKGLSPSPGFSEALKEAADTWGGDEVGLMDSFSANAEKLLLIIAPPGGGGLIGTIVDVLTSPQVQSGFNESSIKGIEAIASFMKVLPELTKAITPPDSVMQAAKEAEAAWTGNGAAGILSRFKETAADIAANLGGPDGLLVKVTSSVTTIIESLAKNKVDAGQTTVLQAVAPLLKSMFEVISSVVAAAPAASKMKKEEMEQFTKVLSGMKEAVGGIFTAINEAIPQMVDAVQVAIQSLAGVDPEVTKTGIGFIKDIMSIVGEIPKLLQVLANAGGEKVPFDEAQATQLTTMIGTVVGVLETLTGSTGGVSSADGSVLTRLAAVFAVAGTLAGQVGQKEGVEQIKSIFSVIREVFNVTKEIKDAFKGGFTAEEATSVQTIIDSAAGTIIKIVEGSFQKLGAALITSKEFSTSMKDGATGFTTAMNVLKQMSPTLKSVSSDMAALSAETAAASFKPIDFTPHLTFMTNVKSFLTSVMGDSKSVGTQMSTAVTETKSLLQNSIKPTIVLIDQIIAETIKLQTQLEKGTSLNIPAKLRVFAGKSMATLGASGKYKISTSPVEVNVNFAIAIDAVKLEKVLVQRKGSIIRDRVHYLLGLTVGGESKAVYDMQKDGKSNPKLTNYMNDGKLGEDPEQGTRIVAPQYDVKQ